jgi:penicillin-binding protein 2
MRPVSGQNVELTIDLALQKTAEESLARVFAGLKAQEEGANGQDAEGGAAVAIDIKTGKILVCASYPTYDLSTFFENYEKILAADYGPLNNRALQMTYAPGSIYKPAMVVAALDTEQITPTTQIVDYGVYTEYWDQGFAPKCMSYTISDGTYTHGAICAAESLMYSCNYFFYHLGDHMGQSTMDNTVKGFGLGELTGVELPEKKGYRANPETKKLLHTGEDAYWYQADQIMAAIGQSDNQFTPMQMCVYMSTLLNQGVRYRATFLNRVVSSDYQDTVVQNTPEIMSLMKVSDMALQTCKEGMRAAVTHPMGTAHTVFGNYPREVGAKTGTAEHGSGGSDNGSFACFAPYDDPQIAIIIFGEKCGGGSLVGSVARDILNVWYTVVNAGDINSGENGVS